jgi:hypothetical protein
MPALTGPLFGDSAKGSIGKTLTFSNWKGKPYLRALGKTTDRKSAGQIHLRNTMRTLLAGVTWANHTAQISPGQTRTDKEIISGLAQPAYPWNAFLIQAAIGVDLATFAAMTALWETFSGAEKTAWDNAATTLEPPMLGARQFAAGGIPAKPLTPGNVYLAYRYGLYALNLSGIPTGDPSNWGPPPEPTVQQLQTASPTTPDWAIPDTYDTLIPGLEITMTPPAGWVHLSANGEASNPGTSTKLFTFGFWVPSFFGEAQLGPPCIITAQPGETIHWDLDFYFQAPEQEFIFRTKAKTDISGGQMVSLYATMSVHALGF